MRYALCVAGSPDTALYPTLTIRSAICVGGRVFGQAGREPVLIAAAFCMYNRYVDGLATTVRPDEAAYQAAAQVIVNDGYLPAVTQP